ncbi:hypothetical protein DSM25558_1772 [Agrobacterium sp. DSM 25558]|nr:hypothetical protein DSM25558_1772 [Agrobacterium sp. DSM 25558]
MANVAAVEMQATIERKRDTRDLRRGGGRESLAIVLEKLEARFPIRLVAQQRLEGQPVHGARRAMTGDGKTQCVKLIAPLDCVFHLIWQRLNA